MMSRSFTIPGPVACSAVLLPYAATVGPIPGTELESCVGVEVLHEPPRVATWSATLTGHAPDPVCVPLCSACLDRMEARAVTPCDPDCICEGCTPEHEPCDVLPTASARPSIAKACPICFAAVRIPCRSWCAHA